MIGGAVREEIPFASYIFYRTAIPKPGPAAKRRPMTSWPNARALTAAHGFTTHKSRAATSPPTTTSP